MAACLALWARTGVLDDVLVHTWPPEVAPYELDRLVLTKVSSHSGVVLEFQGALYHPLWNI